MIKKTLLLAAALVVVLAGTAGAQDYPPSGDRIDATRTTVAPGESMVLGIQICVPASSASFVLDNTTTLGTGTANQAGRAEATVTIPSNTAPGSHTITGSCPDPDGGTLTQVLGITVTAPGQAAARPLPETGSGNALPLSQVAIAAIAGGGLLVLLADRRRRAGRAAVRDTAGV